MMGAGSAAVVELVVSGTGVVITNGVEVSVELILVVVKLRLVALGVVLLEDEIDDDEMIVMVVAFLAWEEGGGEAMGVVVAGMVAVGIVGVVAVIAVAGVVAVIIVGMVAITGVVAVAVIVVLVIKEVRYEAKAEGDDT